MENEPVAAISDCHNSRSGGASHRPFQIMNYRSGNPCGYSFLWDNHNPFSSMAGARNQP